MSRSTLFTSNHSQAVPLPEAVVALEETHQVDGFETGRPQVIVPKGGRWDDLFLSGTRASDDFMTEREQPAAEMRDFAQLPGF